MQTTDLVNEILADEEARNAENYRFMEEQKIKKSLAPAQWEDLKATLADQCAKIKASSPAKIAIEEDGLHGLALTNLRNGKTVSLRYDPDVPCIHVTANGKRGHLGFKVGANAMSVQFMEGSFPRSLTDVVVNLIRRVS